MFRKHSEFLHALSFTCSYLHSCTPPIIHGNLTTDTIFIQHNGLIKIGSGNSIISSSLIGHICSYCCCFGFVNSRAGRHLQPREDVQTGTTKHALHCPGICRCVHVTLHIISLTKITSCKTLFINLIIILYIAHITY